METQTFRARVARLYQSWATRSLLVGAAATGLDVLVLLACVKGLGFPNPAGAMCGVVVGGTFTFFANRHFAFRDHRPELAPQAVRFFVATVSAMVVHAGVVWLLADRNGVPVVAAKFAADILVFTVGQPLWLRHFVFPKAGRVPDA